MPSRVPFTAPTSHPSHLSSDARSDLPFYLLRAQLSLPQSESVHSTTRPSQNRAPTDPFEIPSYFPTNYPTADPRVLLLPLIELEFSPYPQKLDLDNQSSVDPATFITTRFIKILNGVSDKMLSDSFHTIFPYATLSFQTQIVDAQVVEDEDLLRVILRKKAVVSINWKVAKTYFSQSIGADRLAATNKDRLEKMVELFYTNQSIVNNMLDRIRETLPLEDTVQRIEQISFVWTDEAAHENAVVNPYPGATHEVAPDAQNGPDARLPSWLRGAWTNLVAATTGGAMILLLALYAYYRRTRERSPTREHPVQPSDESYGGGGPNVQEREESFANQRQGDFVENDRYVLEHETSSASSNADSRDQAGPFEPSDP